MSPNFANHFTMYRFESDSAYFVVITQKNNQNDEIPVTFMSYAFEGE